MKMTEAGQWEALLGSQEAAASRQRVLRQLFESMLHEEIVSPDRSRAASSGGREWTVEGRSRDGYPVRYTFEAIRKTGFGRYRITSKVVRTMGSEQGEGEEGLSDFSPSQALEELSVVHFPKAEPERLAAFAKELEQTVVNDAFYLWRTQQLASLAVSAEAEDNGGELSLTDWEARVSEAHPYHPCYKSRIGFSLDDHLAYAPEFGPRFALVWIAVRRGLAEVCALPGQSYNEWLNQVLSPGERRRFAERLKADGLEPEDYEYMPVHPWQWANKLTADGASVLLADRSIVLLGEGEELYRPLQSIRTLANATSPGKPYVKTAINIVNTSALRVIGTHHIRNAPIISDWLHRIEANDPYLREECNAVILREVAGAALRYKLLPLPASNLLEDSVAAVFRESVEPYLKEGERAVPYTYVTHRQGDGTPAVDEWLKRYGPDAWHRRLLEVTLNPQLHLLCKYGIGLESHGQNMILIHRDGWPERIALRDLPGGIRCMAGGDRFRDRPPLPDLHMKPDSPHPILTDSAEEVRDFWTDGSLHIQLHEVFLLLTEEYGMEEKRLWETVRGIAESYRDRFPQWKDSIDLFRLTSLHIQVGRLTARKIWGDDGDAEHTVVNPLSPEAWDEDRHHAEVKGGSLQR